MDRGPPILFIVLDGTRKDRVSLYGHDRDTAPHLAAFAEESVVFENAFTPAPWTLPSHTSMFTGYYPSEHGVTNVFSKEPFGLSEGVPTLAENLAERGYRTGGFSNNPWVGQLSGLDRGFETFVEWNLEISSRSDDVALPTRNKMYSKVSRLLGTAARQPLALLKHRFFSLQLLTSVERLLLADGDGPAFAFVNLMETHTPWYPQKRAFRELGLDPPSLFESRRLNASVLRDATLGDGIGTQNRGRIMEYYDSSIRAQDERVGALFDSLKAAGRYDESLIVVCADHGKTLGEFDREGFPPHYLRDININVPLLVKLPNQSEQVRIERPYEMVRLFDFLQTADPTLSDIDSQTTERALVEDFVPHTSDEVEDTMRWRTLSDGDVKYAVNEVGVDFLLRGEGENERLYTDESTTESFRDAMAEKIDEALDRAAASDTSREGMDGTVEAQLKDLGYLN